MIVVQNIYGIWYAALSPQKEYVIFSILKRYALKLYVILSPPPHHGVVQFCNPATPIRGWCNSVNPISNPHSANYQQPSCLIASPWYRWYTSGTVQHMGCLGDTCGVCGAKVVYLAQSGSSIAQVVQLMQLEICITQCLLMPAIWNMHSVVYWCAPSLQNFVFMSTATVWVDIKGKLNFYSDRGFDKTAPALWKFY